MPQVATITSKRQLTIPVAIFQNLNLQKGQKVIVSEEEDSIKIEPAMALLDRLAGSVRVPKRFKGLSPNEIIKKAKEEYFSKR